MPVMYTTCFLSCPAEHYISYDKSIFEESQPAIQFASYLESVFNAPMNFENDTPISSVLYDGMSRTKYLKPSGRSRYTKLLADALNEFYKGLGICNIANMYQIQRVLLRPSLKGTQRHILRAGPERSFGHTTS